MSRTLSSTLLNAIFAQETGEIPAILIEIAHANIETVRVCSDTQDITSNGLVYSSFPFSVALPDDSDDAIPTSRLIIDAVDQSLITAIRSINGPPAVSMSIVLTSDPDTIEIGPITFSLRSVSYNAITIEGEIQGPDILNEGWPGHSFSPPDFPGLFPLS